MSQQNQSLDNAVPGMTRRQAKSVEYSIIGLCLIALVMIFQPFSVTLFSIGAGLVVLGGLAFNLVPFCRPGVPLSMLLRVGLIVLAVLAVAIGLAIGSAKLYAIYLAT
jgi:hypothetical protein